MVVVRLYFIVSTFLSSDPICFFGCELLDFREEGFYARAAQKSLKNGLNYLLKPLLML